MRILLVVLFGTVIAMSQLAVAGPFGSGLLRVQMPNQRPGGHQPPPPQRDFRHPEQPPDRRPDGRMTDDERRALHRDLDRANRELYKGRR